MPQLLSLRSITQEPQLMSPHAATTGAHVPCSPCSATREASAIRSLHSAVKSTPSWPQLEESPRISREPEQPKIRQILYNFIYICNLKKKKNKQKQTYGKKKKKSFGCCQRGWGCENGPNKWSGLRGINFQLHNE